MATKQKRNVFIVGVIQKSFVRTRQRDVSKQWRSRRGALRNATEWGGIGTSSTYDAQWTAACGGCCYSWRWWRPSGARLPQSPSSRRLRPNNWSACWLKRITWLCSGVSKVLLPSFTFYARNVFFTVELKLLRPCERKKNRVPFGRRAKVLRIQSESVECRSGIENAISQFGASDW